MTDRSSPSGLWRIRLAMILVYMVFGALLNSVGPIVLLVVQTMGVSRAEASLLDAFKDLPIAAVSFFVASLLPRLGLRRSMLIGVAAVGLGCLLVPLAASFWAVKLMFVTIGAAFALVKISVYSTIGLVTHDERSHAGFTSLIEGLFMCGVLGGYWLFSRAAEQALAWLDVYWTMAGVVALSFVLLASSPLDERAARPADAGPGGASLREDFVAMWRLTGSGLVLVFLLSAFFYVLVEQGIGTWLPTFNNEVLHMPVTMSVGLAVLMPASTAIGRLASAGLIARLGWYPVVLVCIGVIGALMAFTLPLTRGLHVEPGMSWTNAPAAAYVIPLMGLFLAPIYPAINSAMLSALPKPRHAAMTGLIVIFSALGGSFGSFMTGRLFVAFDGQTAFTLLLLPAAALAFCVWRFRRALR